MGYLHAFIHSNSKHITVRWRKTPASPRHWRSRFPAFVLCSISASSSFYHIFLSFLIYFLACRHHLISTSMHPSSLYIPHFQRPLSSYIFPKEKKNVFVVIITILFPFFFFFDVLPLPHSLSLFFCFVWCSFFQLVFSSVSCILYFLFISQSSLGPEGLYSYCLWKADFHIACRSWRRCCTTVEIQKKVANFSAVFDFNTIGSMISYILKCSKVRLQTMYRPLLPRKLKIHSQILSLFCTLP